MTIDDRDKEPSLVARRLMRTGRMATLATLDAETDGGPYASLTLTACGHDAAPLLLLSDLARHSRNIAGQVGKTEVRRLDGRIETLKACDQTVLEAGEAVILTTPTAGGAGRA